MPRAISIDALGAVIRIDGSALSDTAWDATLSAWQDAEIEPSAASTPAATVAAHGTVAGEAMLTALSTDVTLVAIADRAGHLLMLHAAGLATAEGRVVALVGPSGAGKTTASRVLGREFGYVSDETVAITADGIVLPYRKPLSLIENDRLPKVQRSPTELGLRPLPHVPLRLAALVLLERTVDADRATLNRVDDAEAIAGLAQQASYLGRMTAPLHVIESHIVAAGGVYRICYNDAATLAPLIRELGQREPSRPRIQSEPKPPHIGGGSSPVPRGPAPMWRQVPMLDSLQLDGQRLALLLRGGERSPRIVVLDGIGPTLWRNAAQPASLEALVDATIAAHGQPADADAAALVGATLDEFTAANVLTRN